MKVAIGSDHAGFEYKSIIKDHLEKEGHEVIDLGPKNDESVDYPDFVHPVAEMVEKEEAEYGVIICGSGNGAAMSANKHQGIRAALCWSKELAELSRKHNNANIISIPARFISVHLALAMILLFLQTSFEGGRHERRVGKIACT